jgi:hypothetical protein
MSTEMILSQLGIEKGGVNYSESANAFLSTGYTSAAGNTYFNALRFAEGIVIKEDVGEGYAHTFLNGIRIYSLKNKQLIAERDFHNSIYNKQKVKCNAIAMLMKVLVDAAAMEGVKLDEQKARTQVERVINMAINSDQRTLMQQQSRKYLS